MGDHWLFGKRGYFDQGYRILIIIRNPRRDENSPRGSRIYQFTESVDIMPTILDWSGSDIPRQCDGFSLRPFCHGDPPAPADWQTEVYREFDYWSVDDLEIEKALGISMDQCTLNVILDDKYKYVHFNGLPPLFFDL